MTKHLTLKLTENITIKGLSLIIQIIIILCYVNNYKITLLKHNKKTVIFFYNLTFLLQKYIKYIKYFPEHQ